MVLRGVLVSPEGSAEADPKSARFPAGACTFRPHYRGPSAAEENTSQNRGRAASEELAIFT